MAHRGTAYYDSRGQFFKTPGEATISDISSLLGRIGDGDSLAPGIATMLLEKRAEIEAIFAAHDQMTSEDEADLKKAVESGKVATLPTNKVS